VAKMTGFMIFPYLQVSFTAAISATCRSVGRPRAAVHSARNFFYPAWIRL
jgi:hypothetical protein